MSIPNKMFGNLVAAFPEINLDWLLTGEGAMLREAQGETPDILSPGVEMFGRVIVVDFIPAASATAYVSALRENTQSWPQKIPVVLLGNEGYTPDCLRVFEVGDAAMADRYPAGSLVLAKVIPEGQWHLAEGTVVAAYGDSLVLRHVGRNCLLTGDTVTFDYGSGDGDRITVPSSDLCGIYKAKRVVSSPIF